MAQDIKTSLDKLKTALDGDKTALTGKNVVVAETVKHSDIPALIESIEAGGGSFDPSQLEGQFIASFGYWACPNPPFLEDKPLYAPDGTCYNPFFAETTYSEYNSDLPDEFTRYYYLIPVEKIGETGSYFRFLGESPWIGSLYFLNKKGELIQTCFDSFKVNGKETDFTGDYFPADLTFEPGNTISIHFTDKARTGSVMFFRRRGETDTYDFETTVFEQPYEAKTVEYTLTSKNDILALDTTPNYIVKNGNRPFPECSGTRDTGIPYLCTGDDFNTKVSSLEGWNNVTSLIFTDMIPPSGITLVDVSKGSTRSVVAWIEDTTAYVSGYGISIIADEESRYLFRGFSNLTTIDLSLLDTSRAKDMFMMFYGCSGLTSLDVSSFDTSNVYSFSYMFYNCSGLSMLDVSNFDTSNLSSMNNMFDGCSKITNLDLSNFNSSKLRTISNAFADCTSLETVNVSAFDFTNADTHCVDSAFENCTSLTTIYCNNDWTDMSNVVSDCKNTFKNCTKLTGFKSSFVSGVYCRPISDGGYFSPAPEKFQPEEKTFQYLEYVAIGRSDGSLIYDYQNGNPAFYDSSHGSGRTDAENKKLYVKAKKDCYYYSADQSTVSGISHGELIKAGETKVIDLKIGVVKNTYYSWYTYLCFSKEIYDYSGTDLPDIVIIGSSYVG